MTTSTTLWGETELWDIVVPDSLYEDLHQMKRRDFEDYYGGIVYDLNPDLDDADIRRELFALHIPGASMFSAGRCFEVLAVLLAKKAEVV